MDSCSKQYEHIISLMLFVQNVPGALLSNLQGCLAACSNSQTREDSCKKRRKKKRDTWILEANVIIMTEKHKKERKKKTQHPTIVASETGSYHKIHPLPSCLTLTFNPAALGFLQQFLAPVQHPYYCILCTRCYPHFQHSTQGCTLRSGEIKRFGFLNKIA